jgi:hypothetical protein
MIPTTSPDYGWLYVVFGFFVVIAIILVAIRVNEKPKKPQPEVTQAEEVEPEAKKATSQEAVVQVPKTFSPNCRVCGKPLRLLDEIEQRWYCYEDNQLYYAKDKRWVGEKTRPKKAESKTEKPTTTKNFCIECGSELPLKSKFCNNCGTKQP